MVSQSQPFKILLLIMITPVLAKKVKFGPHWHHKERTTCEEFGKYARFNPYTMPNETWFLFYYWAPMPSSFYFYFKVPAMENLNYLHPILDDRSIPPVNWTARLVMLQYGSELSLLVEQGDRGQYLLYNVRLAQSLPPGATLTALETRMKQTGDNKIVGMMICQKETVFALVRRKELPRKNRLQEEALRLNYRSRGGKSYLYQGHHWMPIPEQNEDMYWNRLPKTRYMYNPSTW